MIAVLLSLTSAVAYGVSDFVGGAASRHVQALRVVLVSYPVSAVVIGLAALLVGGEPSVASLAWGTASGAVMAVAMWWFYMALAEGPMSVVSPVTAVVVAALPVGVGLVAGERPTGVVWLGILVALVAIVLVTREVPVPHEDATPRRSFTPRVAWLTLGAGTFFALSFVFTHRIEAGTGLWPLLLARTVASALVAVTALAMRQARAPEGRVLRLAVLVGLLDVVANVTMLYAFQAGLLSVVSVIIALYPAVTVGFAVVVLGERIARHQIVGLALSLAAVGAVAAG